MMHRSIPSLAAIALTLAASPVAAQSLEQVLEIVLERSPAMEAARAREDAADAAVRQAQAERMPMATLQGQIGTGRIDPQGFFALPAANVTPRVAQVGAEMPILTFGRIGSAVDQAKAGRELAAVGANAAMLDLRLQVIRAYTQALAAQEQVESYSAMATMLEEVVRQSKLMFKVGAATSTDVAQAEARLAEAKAGLAHARGMLATAKAQLATLTGQEVELDPTLPLLPIIPPDAEQARQMALADNPMVAQARKAAEIAEAGVRGAKAERLPTVGVYAEASTIRDQFFPGYKADSASIGVRGRWQFYSGGRVGAKISKAEADARAASADARLAAQAVEVQAVQTFEAVQAAKAMVLAADERARATKEALRSTRLEVEAGAKPQLALLDAMREASAAETAKIQAAGNLLTAAYSLRSVTGMDSL
ncbi:MAG: TolC family protein [Sphingomonadaceae bacterium]|nr:TolC family protein [Sphingomonadaceae bacterium]